MEIVHDRLLPCPASQQRHERIVQAIVTLARNMGIEAIAEGVETADQIVMLQALDCDKVQGFYFARPTPADAATRMIEALPPGIGIAA